MSTGDRAMSRREIRRSLPAIFSTSSRELLTDELRVTVNLPDRLIALLRQPSVCYLATSMADGSPQVTQVWVDTDGDHVLINSVRTHVKTGNIERDPRVALAVSHQDDPSSYFQVRGRVLEITTEGAAEHVDVLSKKYTGEPYAWYGGRDQVRVIFVIEAEAVSGTA